MKNILLTGVSRGLGLITAQILLQNGFCVYGICRKKSYELDNLFQQFPDRLKILYFDLENIDEIKTNIFVKFIPLTIPIHGFVNNAAIAYDDIVSNANYQMLKKSFEINVFAPILLTKNVLRNMLFNNIAGSIIHVSSISVHTGYKGLSMYAASKGALEAFSKNLAREWGSKKIRSNCVVAGFMETDMSSTLSSEQKIRIFKRNSLKGPVDTISVANTIAFLLSEESVSITGQNLFVDNGTI